MLHLGTGLHGLILICFALTWFFLQANRSCGVLLGLSMGWLGGRISRFPQSNTIPQCSSAATGANLRFHGGPSLRKGYWVPASWVSAVIGLNWLMWYWSAGSGRDECCAHRDVIARRAEEGVGEEMNWDSAVGNRRSTDNRTTSCIGRRKERKRDKEESSMKGKRKSRTRMNEGEPGEALEAGHDRVQAQEWRCLAQEKCSGRPASKVTKNYGLGLTKARR
ncbi:hypothetical protein BKA64DRAFT_768527 [Cadophora sp. MPI-SDFR-AT-0126]|nr:hypothetical protein BKA64DRAFT_768527 [Leotiomycetes sp. MPI-SDFR-AT-0126]